MITNNGKLDDLEAGSVRLRDTVVFAKQAFDFDNNSSKLKERFRWQKIKMMLLMGGGALLFLLLLYKVLC